MKEITYEDWIKNPTPRMMWVWDYDEDKKSKEKVVYISEIDEPGKVLSVFQENGQTFSIWYMHCVEIEEPKKRPCTREELIEMLKKQGLPMLKNVIDDCIYTVICISKKYVHIHSLYISNKTEQYTLQQLCEQFNLLDGTELWVEK